MERLARNFETLLESAVNDPQQRIADLQLLTQADRNRLLTEWNSTSINYPSEKTIQQLFEDQAEMQPNAIAMVQGEQKMKYHELEVMANQLAHYLVEHGVKPEMPVGLYLERSTHMIIGILAILKAGGCYLPIDTNYPLQRINYLINSSDIQILLSQQSLDTSAFDNSSLLCLSLDSQWHLLESYPFTPPATMITADNLAYINFTSGSTGLPKGVTIPHRAVVRLTQNNSYLKLRRLKTCCMSPLSPLMRQPLRSGPPCSMAQLSSSTRNQRSQRRE